MIVHPMTYQQSQENSVCICSHFQLKLAGHCLSLSHQLSCVSPMPRLIGGQAVASGSGMPAGSAQADKAQAGSAQADSSGFSLRYPSDIEYNPNFQSSVKQRMSSGMPRPMPDILVDPKKRFQLLSLDRIRDDQSQNSLCPT